MKLSFQRAAAAAATLGAGLVHGQDGHMMNGGWHGGWMGGYGSVWIPILLVVIVGLLVWIVTQRRK